MAQKMAESIEESMVPLPAGVPQGLVAPTPEALYIEGGVACGKTQALVERAASLVAGGADTQDVLVLCATPGAAARFRQRLAQAGPGCAGVRVTTPRSWCLDVLADPQVQDAAARKARLLAPFEADVLMEDMKACGMRPRRLKEMLRFFYKSLTELCDWEQDWLITGEERAVFALLQECLAFEGGILEPELANVVTRCLTQDAGLCAAHSYAHVLVDDYQLLSRASQVLANRVARDSVAVAANPAACAEVFESYPYAEGPAEFLAANPQAKRVVLGQSRACAAAVGAANACAAHRLVGAGSAAPHPESADEAPVVLHAATPAGERELVVSACSEALGRGEEPGDVVVVAPNAVWARNMASALTAAGIPAATPLPPTCVSGDIRALPRCTAARALTALYLAANPEDGVAWRSWVGFGDLFACSSAVKDARAAAADAGIAGVGEAFGHLCAGHENGESLGERHHLAAAWEAGRTLVDATAGKRGEELLRCLTDLVDGTQAEVPAVLHALTAPLDQDSRDDAVAMAARARTRLAETCVEQKGCVQVVGISETAGLTPKTLVLCGLVNGFFPTRGVLDREVLVQEDADKQMGKDLRLLMAAAGKPTVRLVATYFDEVGLEVAERMRMKIRRIQLHDGVRVALAEPSTYLDLIRG